LSWADDGEDDDQILNIKFESLDEDRDEPWRAEDFSYELEDDIKVSMANEMSSKKTVKANRERMIKLRKERQEKND
jgi:hypothetical protein